jgi:hypothetical protein
MYRQIKYLALFLVMLLGLYPIAELTRVILISGEFYFPHMKGQFGAEIAIMWTLYFSIIPVYLLVNSRKLRHYNHKKNILLKKAGALKKPDMPSKDAADYIRVNYSE